MSGLTVGSGFGTAASFTYSGAFTTPTLIAGPIYERSFHSDPGIYCYRVRYRVVGTSYTQLGFDAPGPYGGFHAGETDFATERGGILTFWREFAVVPDTRSEHESYVYAYQICGTVNNAPVSIGEIPLHVKSRVQYDYFLVPGGLSNTENSNDPIVLAKAPRAISVPLGTGSQILYLNGWGFLIAGQEILAEDATMARWKGNIYERKQRFVICQNLGNGVQV